MTSDRGGGPGRAGRRAASATGGRARPTAPGTRETDVLVVGSGGAGYTTALFASRLGPRRRSSSRRRRAVGGTTLKTGGWYWVPNNSLMRAAGHRGLARGRHPLHGAPLAADDVRPRRRTLRAAGERARPHRRVLRPRRDRDRRARRDGRARVSTIGVDVPDYYAQIPENRQVYGRVLYPLKPNGEPARAGGGVEMIRPARRRGPRSRHRRPHEPSRPAARARRRPAASWESRRRPPRVAPSGSARARAVVFASGGFVHDAELRRNYLSDPVFSGCGFHANEGDFVHIAGAVGAAFRNMNYAWMCPLPFEWAVARRPDLSGVFTVPGDSMIFVNKYGRRAANEKAPYNELARSFFAWDAYRGRVPQLPPVHALRRPLRAPLGRHRLRQRHPAARRRRCPRRPGRDARGARGRDRANAWRATAP